MKDNFNNVQKRHKAPPLNIVLVFILAVCMLMGGFGLISLSSIEAKAESIDTIGSSPTIKEINSIPHFQFQFGSGFDFYEHHLILDSVNLKFYNMNNSHPVTVVSLTDIVLNKAFTQPLSKYIKESGEFEIQFFYSYNDSNSNSTFEFESQLLMYNYVVPPAIELPPDPTKEGHTFIGWYLDEALTIAYEGQPITEDMTFYAKFEIHTFTVTFDSNGGSEISSLRIDWNVTPTLSTPVRDGYTFLGWLHNGAVYVAAPVKNDISLTAKWQLNTYTVEFDSAGGNEIASKLVDWNTPVVTDTPSRIGHTFLGWFVGEEKYEGAGIKANTTLTAHWQINKYTVTFMVSGEVYTTLEVEYGTSLKEVMKKNGLLFYSLEVVETEDGKILTGDSVTDIPIIVSVKESTNVQKFFSVVEAYWVYLLCGFIALCVLLTLLIMLLKKKR